VALTRICPFCLEPAAECVCPDTEARATVPACCDLHGRNCELPGDLCCQDCTEVRHFAWTDARGVQRYGHPPGETCSSPDAPPPEMA
jgi:hypothetical protein